MTICLQNFKRIQDDISLSPKTKKSEINKAYCRNTRRKNKQYVKELEQKIEDLEAKVSYLSSQVDKYKHKLNIVAIGDEKDLSDFKTNEEFGRLDLVHSLHRGQSQNMLRSKIK